MESIRAEVQLSEISGYYDRLNTILEEGSWWYSPNKTIEKKIRTLGYHEETCEIISQGCGFVNKECFSYWADTVFFPTVRMKRLKYNYHGTVVLTMDGCTSHFSDYFLDECSYYGVFPLPEPSGSSDQIQPLDLGIFAAQKKIKSSLKNHASLSKNTNNIIKIVDSWHKCTTPSNIVSAFNKAGIYSVEKGDEVYAQANIMYAKSVRGMEHDTCPSDNSATKTSKLQCFD